MTQRTLELLESLMAGYEMTSGELDELLRDQVPEDLFLDYKHGNLLMNGREANKTIRQYLSGFANSAGGILIVGVDEASWSVAGCSTPGGGDLGDWASRCLNPIAHYFSPLPRFYTVAHPRGNVLVASTDRSLSLVPCIERGGLVHYFRIHDQTLEAPEYLMADISLGRRQHAQLHIAEFRLSGYRQQIKVSGHQHAQFSLSLRIENQGLSCAEDVRLGIISLNWSPIEGRRVPIGNHLLQYIEVQYPDEQNYPDDYVLIHSVNSEVRVEAFTFEILSNTLLHSVPLSKHGQWYNSYDWKAAVYLLARGTPPTWYQLSINVSPEALACFKKGDPLSSESDFLQIRRLSGQRPIVAWEGIQLQ